MAERIWDLEPHQGRDVYLIVVDDCSGPFGHINIDSIEERWIPIDTDGGDGSGIKPDQKIKRMTDSEVEPEQAPAPAIDSYPNPFNPETAIRFSGRPNARLTVAIYTPSGGAVARFDVRTDASGAGVVHWNGRDSAGRPVAAGVYFAALIDRERVLGVRKLVLMR
jgi:hypothetical protein